MDNIEWNIGEDIQCQQLTAEYLEEALTFMEKNFYPYENICRTIQVSKDAPALIELRELKRITAADGVSIIAIDKKTKRIAGAAFNKLQAKDNPAFEIFAKTWKQEKARDLVSFMAEFDNYCNLFEYLKIDCLLEIMFVATSSEYQGRGIARKLCEISIEIASKLAKGIDVKKSIDGKELKIEPKPKAVSSIFTSKFTQKIGRKLNFEIAVEKHYDELDFRGIDFSKVIETGTKVLTLEYKKL